MTLSKKLTIATAVLLVLAVLAGVLAAIVYGTTLTRSHDVVSLPYLIMDASNKKTVHRLKNKYLGHPDTVMTRDGTLFTMYPSGHGKGAIITQKSDDFGNTYTNVTADMPKSWEDSRETPTLHALDFTDGSQKLIMISGKPSWGGTYTDLGFQSSLSSDGGNTWSEFRLFYPQYDSIVAMASLVHLKENGQYVDKWMGVFHDYSYTNYSTILTFDETGKEQFSPPRKYLQPHRDIESTSGMCEIGITRDPSSDTLILIARANNKVSGSMISFSEDEGMTWTKPKQLPPELSGDRHKIAYDSVSGKLAISFRHVPYGKRANAFEKNDIILGHWVMWIGDYQDLLSYQTDTPTKGDCLIELGHDYRGKADTGYAGIVANQGIIHTVSYGYFDRNASVPYIMSVNFNLGEFLTANGIK